MKRSVAIAGLMLLASCAFAARSPIEKIECLTDQQCTDNKVCFPDGCGDPGMGLVVEVTGDNTAMHAQDFSLDERGGPSALMDLNVRGPLTLAGKLQKEAPNQGGTVDFTDGVTIAANGQSDLIPGVFRRYQVVLPRADQAAYKMYIGAGTYNVTAIPSEAAIPYQSKHVTVEAGLLSGVSFTFPDWNLLPVLTGRLVRSTKPTTIFQSDMTIQAFETAGGAPLSQPATVSNTSQGTFTIYMDPTAASLSSVTLVATPKSNSSLVPTKAFVIKPVPFAQASVGILELGDFGPELPSIKGTLVDSSGKGIGGATVWVEGMVAGDGVFKSTKVLTDSSGLFVLNSLASAPDATFTLTAIPPPASSAGILQAQVRADLFEGSPALLTGSPPTPKTQFTCPDRLTVSGNVLTPDGAAAVGVRVVATPIAALDMRPVPAEPATVFTGADGKYTLALDPAK